MFRTATEFDFDNFGQAVTEYNLLHKNKEINFLFKQKIFVRITLKEQAF